MSAKRTRRTGPGAVEASVEARKRATVILETMTGLRSTQEAAEALGVAPARYYQLETYALQGMVEALEPRQRGRKVSAEQELERQRAEVARLEREVARQQALYRSAQRALGVPSAPAEARAASKTSSPKKATSKKKAVRRRNKRSRGERIAEKLNVGGAVAVAPASSPEISPQTSDRSTKS